MPRFWVSVALLFNSVHPSMAGESISAALARLTSAVNGIQRTGTGFVVAIEGDTAFLLTAAHVVEGKSRVTVDLSVDRSRSYRGRILNNDPSEDLSLVRISNVPDELEPLAISSMLPEAGERVEVWGFPQRIRKPRLMSAAVSGYEGTRLVLSGTVVASTSGSPVLKRGQVIGLLVADDQRHFAQAIPGASLRRAVESWLSGSFDLPEPAEAKKTQIEFFLTDIYGIPLPGLRIAKDNQASEPSTETGSTTLMISSAFKPGADITLRLIAEDASIWIILNKNVHIPILKESKAVHLIAMKRSDFWDFARMPRSA